VAEFTGRARVSLAGIAARKPPPIETRIHVSAGFMRLSQVGAGSGQPYLVTSFDQVTASKGDGRGAVRLQLGESPLSINFRTRRSRRRFLAALAG